MHRNAFLIHFSRLHFIIDGLVYFLMNTFWHLFGTQGDNIDCIVKHSNQIIAVTSSLPEANFHSSKIFTFMSLKK